MLHRPGHGPGRVTSRAHKPRVLHALALRRTAASHPSSCGSDVATRPGLAVCGLNGRMASNATCASAAVSPSAWLPQQRRRARSGPLVAASAASSSAAAEEEEVVEDWMEIGPAFKATLKLLEWPRLCEHVAEYANTTVGKRMVRNMLVPESQAESERLQRETR